jgi:hypothetical protein
VKTDDLIRALSQDTKPARPVRTVLVSGLIPALALAVVAIWMTLGFRTDFVAALSAPFSVMRYVLTGALGAVALTLALRLSRPEGAETARFWPLAVVAVAALSVLVWAYLTTPAEGRQMALVGKTMVTCLVAIPLLSILPVGAILFALRNGAPSSPALTGAIAGLAGSGFAAAIYALHCIEDSPLFYVTWYSLAILSVTLVSTLIGQRMLRW